LGIGVLLAASVLTHWIVAGDTTVLILAALALLIGVIVLTTLDNWRIGVYLFLLWVVFQDLPRKYLANSMLIYSIKDVLACVAYLSFFWVVKRKHAHVFRPPFWAPLLVFISLCLLQVFNPNSPSFMYGLLGMKLYLYYIPLMFLGYALIRSVRDLQQFFIFNLAVASIVAILGITQAIIGLDFLNPERLAPELVPLGRLVRYSPISRMAVPHPTSVFVSSGRFSSYMLLMFILAFGAILSPRAVYRSRKLVVLGIGLAAIGIFLSGSRGSLLMSVSGALVVFSASLWARKRGFDVGHSAHGSSHSLLASSAGATARYWRERPRLISATRQTFVVIGLAILIMLIFLPNVVGARWAFYSETLSPESQYFDLRWRTWDYPIGNFKNAFYNPNWPVGDGIGTGSLGMQYVAKYFGLPQRPQMLESGYGTLLVEMGILGLLLWLIWTLAVIRACWRTVCGLRNSSIFPLAFAIFWFIFLLLIPGTYGGIQSYQNYILNAYLWLLLGILFRLGSVGFAFSGAWVEKAS
jgi:hypothetical protein